MRPGSGFSVSLATGDRALRAQDAVETANSWRRGAKTRCSCLHQGAFLPSWSLASAFVGRSLDGRRLSSNSHPSAGVALRRPTARGQRGSDADKVGRHELPPQGTRAPSRLLSEARRRRQATSDKRQICRYVPDSRSGPPPRLPAWPWPQLVKHKYWLTPIQPPAALRDLSGAHDASRPHRSVCGSGDGG